MFVFFCIFVFVFVTSFTLYSAAFLEMEVCMFVFVFVTSFTLYAAAFLKMEANCYCIGVTITRPRPRKCATRQRLM